MITAKHFLILNHKYAVWEFKHVTTAKMIFRFSVYHPMHKIMTQKNVLSTISNIHQEPAQGCTQNASQFLAPFVHSLIRLARKLLSITQFLTKVIA